LRYNRLGNTGLYVSEICFGAMTFAGRGMFAAVGQLGQEDADRLIRRSIDSGINFIDTADVYSEGESERMTGKALKSLGVKRTGIVIATKAFAPMGPGPNDGGASRGHLMDAVRASLERLGTDYIDLYQIHAHDLYTPVEETMRALDDLVRMGLVRYIGVSNWPAWVILKAQGLADRFGRTRLDTLQAYYSIVGRELEREIIPALADQKMGLLVWSPLAGGLLSGKFQRDAEGPQGARRSSFDFPPVDRERLWRCLDVMRPIAEAHLCSPARVAIAWLLSKSAVTSVIIGAKTVEQLEDNIAASSVTLSSEEIARIDEVSALAPEYPAWMRGLQLRSRPPQPAPPDRA
jgi:aryl-alcohol dehydrogenase-like predicted oxidoreductase